MSNIKKINWEKIVPWVAIIVLLYTMTLLQVPMIIRNVFLVIASSVYVVFIWKDNSIENWEVLILILGLIARIIFCCMDVYTDFSLPIGGGDDGITFLKTAIEYYNGDFHTQYTRYPYVIYWIFRVTGINQFAVQYVNILCWGFGALLLQKSCKRLEISGVLRLAALAVFSWMPTNIYISSILYRDTFVMLLLFLSYYFLLRWMQEGKNYDIVFSSGTILLASLLHGGSVISLVPILITVLFFSREKKKFCISKKNMLMLVIIVGVAFGLLMIPQIRDVVMRKIPNMENGLIVGLNEYLAGKYDYSEGAGSNYLENRYLTGYFDIIILTVQRIYYHMFSPVPHMWRGMTDAIAFFFSTAPVYLVATILWIVSIFYQKKESYRFVLFMEIFVTIGVYAWGNVNGGTALRHREKILGLVILLTVYSLNIILRKRKEQKNIEKINENEF